MNFSPKFKYVKPPKSPLLILNKKNKTNENIKEDLPWGKTNKFTYFEGKVDK